MPSPHSLHTTPSGEYVSEGQIEHTSRRVPLEDTAEVASRS